MIDVKVDKSIDISEDEIEDVNVGIHKEYDMLVFRYANLLKQYLDLQKEYMKLLKQDNETMKELMELKEMHRKRSVRFCGYSGGEDDLK